MLPLAIGNFSYSSNAWSNSLLKDCLNIFLVSFKECVLQSYFRYFSLSVNNSLYKSPLCEIYCANLINTGPDNSIQKAIISK